VDDGPSRIGEKSLPEELGEFDLVSDERACDVDSLSSDNCHSLALI